MIIGNTDYRDELSYCDSLVLHGQTAFFLFVLSWGPNTKEKAVWPCETIDHWYIDKYHHRIGFGPVFSV